MKAAGKFEEKEQKKGNVRTLESFKKLQATRDIMGLDTSNWGHERYLISENKIPSLYPNLMP